MVPTATALVGFAGWFLLLTFALTTFRTALVLGGKSANSFKADGSDVSAFGQRLNRARDNCFETLPIFAAIALGASIAGRLDVTNPLAMYVLYARIGQSITHVASTSVPAVQLRFAFFLVQIVIYAIWIVRLLG